MSTIKRLRRLTGEASKPIIDSSRSNQRPSQAYIDETVSRRPVRRKILAPTPYEHHVALHDVIRGEEVTNRFGKFFIVHRRHTGSSKHGNRRLKDISSVDMKAAAILANDADIVSFACHDALFLDTEIMELAGGTGTFRFFDRCGLV